MDRTMTMFCGEVLLTLLCVVPLLCSIKLLCPEVLAKLLLLICSKFNCSICIIFVCKAIFATIKKVHSNEVTMKLSLLALYFVFVLVLLMFDTAFSVHSLDWIHHVTLDSNNQFHLKWLFDLSMETIVFNVCVRTKGWIGFGISPSGGMTGSDLIITWVDSYGRAHLQVKKLISYIIILCDIPF